MTLTLDPATARHLARAARLLLTTEEELAARFVRLVLASCMADTQDQRALALAILTDWRSDIQDALEDSARCSVPGAQQDKGASDGGTGEQG
jgi:hypothetical protein